jgi:hypothetical protein
MSNTKTNPWDWDLRVRDRNLRSGTLEEKELQKHLGALVDLEGQVDSFTTPQPLFASAEDMIDDDDDQDDDDAPEAPAQPAS